MKELVTEAGFGFEEHQVTTEDGYILTMHRVVSKYLKKDAPVIIMQHGLLASSDGWTANGPKESPAFKFANAGYDVWLGNNRGNYHSRKHVTLDPKEDEEEFFTYSFVELGKYDLPA